MIQEYASHFLFICTNEKLMKKMPCKERGMNP